MREILKELSNMGKTIIISSHILPELAELSDFIGVIEDGEMITIGSVDDIYQRMKGQKFLKIRVKDRFEELKTKLKEMSGITSVKEDGQYILAGFTGTDDQQINLLKHLIDFGFPIKTFGEAEGNLEEIFLEITKGA